VAKIGRTVVLVSVLMVIGCEMIKQRLGRAGDAAADAVAEEVADAATITVGGTGAKNEKDVVRYAAEENIEDEEDELEKEMAVRTVPRSGAIVVTLAKGTKVMKIAKYSNAGVLVEFKDPSSEGLLMGWVPPAAFVESASPKPKSTLSQLRDGGARPVDAGAKPEAGADAGAMTTTDAGPASTPSNATGPKKTDLTWPPEAGGKCPADFVYAAPLCRRVCTTDADCPRGGSKCVGVSGGKKYCSTDVR
jgi:hypothetical protein